MFNLWDKRGRDAMTMVADRREYHNPLTTRRTELLYYTDVAALWTPLLQLGAIDRARQERFQYGATRGEQVDRLLDFIQRGPVWRFHSLLRAFSIIGDEHMIILIGQNPASYTQPSTSFLSDTSGGVSLTMGLQYGPVCI